MKYINYLLVSAILALSSPAVALPFCLRTVMESGVLLAPFQISFSVNGQVVQIPTTSTYLNQEGNRISLRSTFPSIAEFLLQRNPAEQARINASLRAGHEETENSFVTSSNGHSEFFIPEVNGMVLPLRRSYTNRLLASTQPVLRRKRKILQGYCSNANLDARRLGINDFSDTDRRSLLDIFAASPFFEPKLRHPAMAKYPFLFAAGFDALIRDPENPETIFFECNLGAPSGMSNNPQLLELLRTRDPGLFAQFKDRLPADDTFAVFRRVLEGNALAWTGVAQGISVILSPGPDCGAHPDIAYHSTFSGLPLVRPRDLYQDGRGYLRLNVGRGAQDPVVTGIYNRMEESFLLNSPEHGIPARSPGAKEINAAIAQAKRITLDPHVLYDYVYDPQGNAVDVRRLRDGRPALQRIWERVSPDPYRPGSGEPNLVEAVVNRRLYISNLGGRLVDDKRVFALVAKYERMATEWSAAPPPTLERADIEALRNGADLARLAQLVVKEPDLSGAKGVNIIQTLEPEAQTRIVRQLLADPQHFTVQHFMTSIALLAPEGREEQIAHAYGSRVIDMRVFAFFDAEGNVHGGPNSFLLRVAKKNQLLPNTSAGGGYGVAVVLEENATFRDPQQSLLPDIQREVALPAGRIEDYRDFLLSLLQLRERTAPGEKLSRDPVYLESLASKQRLVMDLVPRQANSFMSSLRAYGRGEIIQEDLRARLAELEHTLQNAILDANGTQRFLAQQYLGDAFPRQAAPVQQKRNELLAYLSSNGFPLMVKRTAQGPVPVLLVNAFNVKMLGNLLHHSIGFQVEHQPTHSYDHGYMRVGNIIADRDSPGRRSVGEIHRTGITWHSVEETVFYRQQTMQNDPEYLPNVRIENAFIVPAEDRHDAELYQRVRRAAIYDQPYFTGNGVVPPGRNYLTVSENCFTFAKSTNLEDVGRRIRARLSEILGGSPERALGAENIAEFLASARREILSWPVTFDTTKDEVSFAAEKVLQVPVRGVPAAAFFESVLGTGARARQLPSILWWLVARDAVDRYQALLQRWHVSSGSGFKADLNSGYSHLVLIYDWRNDAFARFSNGTYDSVGRTGQWTSENQEAYRYAR